MKKFLIAGSSLATIASACSAGAVDITLGGSIDMGVEFGVGKDKGSMSIGDAYNSISLSIAAAGTTDAGLMYGASFSFATSAELSLDNYTDAAGDKHLVKMTVEGATDIEAAAYNVSGGQMINAAEIVGVKINSSWMSVGDTQTGYGLALDGVEAADVCKVGGMLQGYRMGTKVSYGIAAQTPNGALTSNPQVYNSGVAGADGDQHILVPVGDYLPAGQVVALQTQFPNGTVESFFTTNGNADILTFTAGTVNGNDNVQLAPAAPDTNGFDAGDMFDVRLNDGNTSGYVDDDSDTAEVVVSAKVFAGPFMEVKLQSSSTKMVVGAVCVEGVDASSTNYFMDVASKVLTASDATVFIEGGFGKITVQTGDYAGGVSAIGDAGDAADLDVEGLAVIVEGVGLLGANPFLAVDLAPTTADGASNLTNLEILTGGTIDLGGLSAAVDVSLLSTDVLEIGSWDLGLDYTMGDMAVAFAYDSSNAWGMSASMDVAGFGVDATIYNKAADAHEKSGLFYSLAASTSLNGVGLSLGVDQDLQPTLSLSKSMGGLSLYAGYDAADQGGKVGATLSF